jgi:Na+/H+-dicarboxylate symporter
MLSIIFFAFLAGIFTTRLPEKYSKVIGLGVNAGFELIMKITQFVIKFTPLGVMAIIAGVVSDNMSEPGLLQV